MKKLMFASIYILFFAGMLFADDTARIKFSGILGQSQPEGMEPLPFIGASGVAMDRKGNLWTADGKYLYGFTKMDGDVILAEKIPLKNPAVHFGIISDGRKAFFISYDWKVYSFDPETKEISAVCDTKDKAGKIKSYCISPDGLEKGYAGKGKVFVLEGVDVHGYKSTGESIGVVLSLPPVPEGQKWHYCAIGIEPNSGDLLVGSYYPDAKTYRFGADGRQVIMDGWPRKGIFARYIINLNNLSWALTAGGGATSLPATSQKNDDIRTIPPSWTEHANGLAANSEGYWLSTSQGIVQFDKDGKSNKKRIGGIAGVRGMAVAAGGTVIASVEAGQRMLRFSIDDEPDTTFTSNGNEPFRVGAGWTDKACGIGWDGKLFLVLDETGKQIWRFDPWHTGWKETPWMPLSEKGTFHNPVSMAVGNKIWVLDDGRILEGEFNAPSSFRNAGMPEKDLEGAKLITGSGARIVIASSAKVTAYMMADGGCRKEWEKEGFSGIAGIA
ncbi:MAG: hypothetical protein WAX69_13410, partial [Victivallales bacterium]